MASQRPRLTTPAAVEPATTEVTATPRRARRLSEDWVATILGLSLLALALVGAIPAGLVP